MSNGVAAVHRKVRGDVECLRTHERQGLSITMYLAAGRPDFDNREAAQVSTVAGSTRVDNSGKRHSGIGE